MENAPRIWSHVEARRDALEAMSDAVWAVPETCYREIRSAALHAGMLSDLGFRLSEGVAGIPTAMVGEAGEGGPVVAILGEFDALPGLSQEAGIAEPRPVEAGGNGHGCGHNLLGAGALLAAAAVKDWLAETGTPGRVRYYGCPAEEGGGAKAFMVKAGLFDDVDIALSWHPESICDVMGGGSLANTRIDFAFHGRAAHAAAAPHLGRSALDAVELTNVGVNYLREHMPPDARVHYAMIDGGGIAPNVVQPYAKVRYSVRASTLAGMTALLARVVRVAEGAAMMTETRVEPQVLSAVSNLVANAPLMEAMRAELGRLGPVEFDAADRAFAAAIRETLTEDDRRDAYARFGIEMLDERPLCDFLVPADVPKPALVGSTDVADVSWVVPLVQLWGATAAIGTPLHSWQMVAQGRSPAARKGMVHAAKVMAATAVEAISSPDLVARAKADLARRVGPEGYASPLPDGTEPPIAVMAA
ncbi:amidohydrolase [Aurantimonas sp. Leaf443]|uniref:amidohydrolase n=1 Tax=Aurantimonas sp. Leaf443 TaxID=1736378 RepID=UPI0006F423BA|nr:amidohydrolase [Aurantimonas sp. Leaf443]KQT88259.1 amidohydrolase [Aurantimonas sp. Leaf443]